jgi:gliding motility-associated-like protein
MKLFILFIVLLNFVSLSFSQITTDCFEITSILVDGCAGSEEGKNEMVGFRVGPNPINVSDLSVDAFGSSGQFVSNSWPNNPFLGFSTTPQAQANLQILNDAIIQCGQLLEPPGGVIPAGANVIIITSTEFTPITTYFENLTQTIYVIFQTAGNTAGHFVNFGSGTVNQRTLILNHLPSGCADTVTYDRTLLLDANGLPGAQDGGAVSFDFNNNASYYNNGCQAPVNPVDAIILGDNTVTEGPTACEGGTINMLGIISGDFIDFTWSGGTGTFLTPTSLSTVYQLGVGDVGTVTLTLTINAPCNVVLTRTYQITIEQPFSSPLTLDPTGTINLCAGQSVTLTASGGAGTYLWSTGETSNEITVSNTDTYTVLSENACQSEELSVAVVNGSSLSLQSSSTTTTCDGLCDASATVNVVGGNTGFNFAWDNNAGNQTTNVAANLCVGTYTCTVSDASGTCSSTIDVTISNPIPVTYTTTVTPVNCSGECTGEITINPSGGTAPYTFLTFDQNGNQLFSSSFLCEGDYTVSVADNLGCLSTQVAQTNSVTALNPISYTKSNNQSLCLNESLSIAVNITSSNTSVLWSTNETSSSILISPQESTNYIFTLTNGVCTEIDTIKITTIDCTIPVIDPTTVLFPNIFSPNNDNKNDFFEPISLINASVESFVILNRWGNLMVEYKDNNIKWDGTIGGKESNDGTYFYILSYKNLSNETKTEHGFFVLSRD